jgi:hypothetical protein
MFFVYPAFFCSDSVMITLGADVEHVLWRPSLAQFAPPQEGGHGLLSTGKPSAMEAIPLQSGAEVTVAAPPPSSAGKENEIAAPESPSGRVHGLPAWSELEENEGATPVSANVVAEPGGKEAQTQADKSLTQMSGLPA